MTPHLSLILPILIPLTMVGICTFLIRQPRAQRVVSLTGTLLLLIAGASLLVRTLNGTILVTQFGGWRAPYGISFVADRLAAGGVLLTGVMAFAISVYTFAWQRDSDLNWSRFYPAFHGLLLGLVGAFLTGDLFNLYICFEVMLISSFGLLVFPAQREQLDAGVKYTVLNLIATSIILLAVGFLYGLTGTLNMADLSLKVPLVQNQGLVFTLAVLLLIAFGAKAAAFPMYFWLPAAYPVAALPVIAIFSALLTKISLYSLIRLNTLIFSDHLFWLGSIVGVIAILNMISGVLGAASHYDVRRILAFHSISQMGYIMIGLAIATPLAIAGSVLFMLHHCLVKTNLFLIAGAMKRATGTFDLKAMGGLRKRIPSLATLFFLQAVSLAGIPPFSGFWAKFLVVRASLEAHSFGLAAVALAVGLLTLYSMIKIWNEGFLKPESRLTHDTDSCTSSVSPEIGRSAMLAISGIAAMTLIIALIPEPFVDYSIRTADQLLNPAQYVQAVLNPGAIPPSGLSEGGQP